MRHYLYCAALSAVLAAAAVALPPDLKLTADKPAPAAGDLVTVTADSPGKVVRWLVIGDAQSKTDSAGRSVVIVGKSGSVTVLAVAGSETGDLSEFTKIVFAFGPPEPAPAPEAPSLKESLKAAITLLPPEEVPLVKTLSEFYGKAAVYATDPTLATWGQLFARLKVEAEAEGFAGKLAPVQKAVRVVTNAELPTAKSGDVALDAAGRAKATATFKKVSAALAEASK